MSLKDAVKSANTGLDAIKRAPIVDHDTGRKCIRIQDVSQSKKYVNWGFTDVTDANFIKFQLKRDDILIARTGGSIGVNRYIDKTYNSVFNNGLIRLRVDEKNHCSKFIYYLLQTDSFKTHINSIAFGTAAQPNMKIRDLLDFKFLTLNKSHEETLALTLDALSDRIALLRETNTTLQSIAQALFKSWFVDFDPVHANAGTQAPSLPPEIQSLFPSTFVESTLGLVPEGWGVGKVEDVMELAYGKALKASDRVHGDVPVYGSGGITGCHSESLVNGPSIIVGRKGTVGTLYWEDRAFFPIDTVFYVKPKVSLRFCYYLLRSLPLADMNTDAAVPGLNRNNVYRLEVVMPPEKILMDFDQTVSLLRASIFSNDQKIQHLSALRDTLLPRLISGQLRLPEVEEHIQEIA